MGREATIETECPVTGESIHLDIETNGPAPEMSGYIHFAVPAALWWDDIGYTGSTILFFRSEENIQSWCRGRDLTVGGVLSLDTAWQLAGNC